jgi:death-on-curing protein
VSEPVWIDKSLALRIHELQLMEHGGEDGYLNEGHLDAALARPQAVYNYLPDTSLEELAALRAVIRSSMATNEPRRSRR